MVWAELETNWSSFWPKLRGKQRHKRRRSSVGPIAPHQRSQPATCKNSHSTHHSMWQSTRHSMRHSTRHSHSMFLKSSNHRLPKQQYRKNQAASSNNRNRNCKSMVQPITALSMAMLLLLLLFHNGHEQCPGPNVSSHSSKSRSSRRNPFRNEHKQFQGPNDLLGATQMGWPTAMGMLQGAGVT